MTLPRFIMVGGFLGAGKTTTLARLAQSFTNQGRKVGIVTNDQAQELVDTSTLRSLGFAVEEVPGACFCCTFDQLLNRAGNLEQTEQPEVILAEPVGSCTDLVATVVQPLKDLYRTRFQVAPYTVLFKPSHGLRILRGEPAGGFSTKAAYIFRKQLEEADAILINRTDELPAEDLDEIRELVRMQYPGTPVLGISARTGDGFAALEQLLAQEGLFGRKILDIDYDVYAEGEAELGWLNLTARLEAETPFDLDDLLTSCTRQLGQRLTDVGGEIAHLKLIGLGAAGFGVANQVSSQTAATLSLPAHQQVMACDLVVNARVAMDPDTLDDTARQVLQTVCTNRRIHLRFPHGQHLRPARPVPTHRYAEVKG